MHFYSLYINFNVTDFYPLIKLSKHWLVTTCLVVKMSLFETLK